MIHFLWVKSWNCCEIYQHLHEVFGKNAIAYQVIMKWCNMLRTNKQILTMLKVRKDYQLPQVLKFLLLWVNPYLQTGLLPYDFHLFSSMKAKLKNSDATWMTGEGCKLRMVNGILWDFFAEGIEKYFLNS